MSRSNLKKTIIAAITLDGKIATNSKHNVDWTSKEDKNFFRSETKKAGVVIFGSKTYEAMGKEMLGRLNIVMTKNPKKYIKKQKDGVLEFSSSSPKMILDNLAKRGYNKVIIGGGSDIYSLFLRSKLVDEIYLTIAPKIFGKGVNLFGDMNIEEIGLEMVEFEKIGGGGEVLIRYKVK